MIHSLIHTTRRALHQATVQITTWVNRLAEQLHEIYARHLELMADEPAYRAQIVAGAAAVLTMLRIPPPLSALLLALLGLHAAAYGPTRRIEPAWRDDPYETF